MNSLKVLLITYAFPPAGGVGVLRAASLARYLPQEGIRLDVLTTRNPASVGSDASLLRDIPADVTVHRTITLDVPFGLKKTIKRIITGANPPAKQPDKEARLHKPGLLKRMTQDILLPDPQVTWFPIASAVATRIIRKRKIDLVLITAAPFSNLLLVGHLRKHFPSLPIVVDFRDEWLTTCFETGSFQFSRSERAHRVAVETERAAIQNATAVVSVTAPSNHEVRGRYPEELDEKFVCIPNGFDATRLPPPAPPESRSLSDRIVVTHIGSVYALNEPMQFVNAVLGLPESIRSRFFFRFIGHIEEPRYREALLTLGEQVELKDYMPQREALAALRDTDYVLLIKQGRLNIVAKFYDYLGGGKPILGILHPEAPERQLIEDLRVGWWASERDVDGIRQLLTEAVRRVNSLPAEFQPDSQAVAAYERRPLAHRYANLLHSLHSEALRTARMPGK